MKSITRNMAGIWMILLSACLCADEEQKPKINPDAIPPVISPDDLDMKPSAKESIRLLNAKKADHVTRGVQVGGKPITNNIERRRRERIHREKIDANPRQTIPLKQCMLFCV